MATATVEKPTVASPHEPTEPLNGEQPLTSAQTIPKQSALDAAAELPVWNIEQQSQPFSTLTGSKDDSNTRHLVIFIRHFFCGMCQDFIKHLAEGIKPEELEKLPQKTQISIVGCGSPDLISFYGKETGCPFPIYTDPSRKLFETFGMISTLASGKKPAYQRSAPVTMIVKSIYQSMNSGSKVLKGGNWSQVGGEYLFEDGKLAWCHQMQSTRDHTEVVDLRKKLGLD